MKSACHASDIGVKEGQILLADALFSVAPNHVGMHRSGTAPPHLYAVQSTKMGAQTQVNNSTAHKPVCELYIHISSV